MEGTTGEGEERREGRGECRDRKEDKRGGEGERKGKRILAPSHFQKSATMVTTSALQNADTYYNVLGNHK